MAKFTALARRFGVVLVAFGPLLAACSTVRPAATAPEPGTYFVAPVFLGDTLASFAARHDAKVEDLQKLNRIRNPSRRLSGGFMRVPVQQGGPTEQRAVAAQQRAVESVRPAVTPAPSAPPRMRPASIERQSLAPLSPGSSPSTRSAVNSRVAPAVSAAAVESAQRQPEAPEAPAAQSSWTDWMMLSVPPAEPLVEGERRFVWPVEGEIISVFGQQPGGGRNDGINIAAARGTPVRAADAGEVSYVGNELKGYGNLILIRHDDGFVTAYAHADGVSVRRGERVERGQVIGSAGDTGDVSRPQLHFELRRGTTPVDPTLYLAASNDSSSERLAEGSR